MPEDREALEAWIKDHPETRQPGTPEHYQAEALNVYAHFKGWDVGSPEYLALLDEHIGAASGDKGGAQPRDRTGGGNGGDKAAVKLSDAQKEIVKLTGLTDAEYAQNVQLLADHKQQGYFG